MTSLYRRSVKMVREDFALRESIETQARELSHKLLQLTLLGLSDEKPPLLTPRMALTFGVSIGLVAGFGAGAGVLALAGALGPV